MPSPESTGRSLRPRPISPAGFAAVIAVGVSAIGYASAADDQPSREVDLRGAELFAREWLPTTPGVPGPDGLGPVYNETSCIACHHQGGPGGAGPTSTNVEILSTSTRARKDTESAAEHHPGFRNANSVVLHRFGVDPVYKAWRLKLLGEERLADMAESVETEIQQVQQQSRRLTLLPALSGGRALRSALVLSQRNPPALFGVGLIDALADDVLVTAAEEQFPEFPEIRGRVNRLKDGRIGRFGWKAETPDLRDFVLSACANELGLEVPGHRQAASPLDPEAKAKGLDLTQDECDALVAYVRGLRGPSSARPAAAREPVDVSEGRTLFEGAGCGTCHRTHLGDVEGIYSDLLLHDLGPALSDSGSYYGENDPSSPKEGVKTQEWRTPPLWGFRESAPYLHDGRARDVEQAVAFHEGAAERSAQRFFKLAPEERLRVQAFLRSLRPPSAAGL
jgi:CxxC motif-containing protein (DUF1111 family)